MSVSWSRHTQRDDIECARAFGHTADFTAQLLGIDPAIVQRVWDEMDQAITEADVVPAKPFVAGER